MASSSWLPQLWSERESEQPFQAMRRQFDELLDEFRQGMGVSGGAFASRQVSPRLDFWEDDKACTLLVELPGVEQKDVEVSLSGRQLIVRGEKRAPAGKEAEERTCHRMECSFGPFQRSVMLPYEADPSSISATFRDGVLNITVPKPANIRSGMTKIAINRPS